MCVYVWVDVDIHKIRVRYVPKLPAATRGQTQRRVPHLCFPAKVFRISWQDTCNHNNNDSEVREFGPSTDLEETDHDGLGDRFQNLPADLSDAGRFTTEY